MDQKRIKANLLALRFSVHTKRESKNVRLFFGTSDFAKRCSPHEGGNDGSLDANPGPGFYMGWVGRPPAQWAPFNLLREGGGAVHNGVVDHKGLGPARYAGRPARAMVTHQRERARAGRRKITPTRPPKIIQIMTFPVTHP